MQRISLQIESNASDSYDVIIGSGAYKELKQITNSSDYSKVFVLSDSAIWEAAGDLLKPHLHESFELILIQPGEENKSADTLQKVWEELQAKAADRKSLLLNYGGGVIGDLGGFAASTYMRGMDFVQLPTTLLSQVDASVGGKTGINFQGVKNLVGAFNQPKAVIIDVDSLRSLPEVEFQSGMAENIKHALIADKSFFDFLKNSPASISDTEGLTDLICKSVQIKADIVARDEKESGARKLLNFGHTAGHAVESLLLGSDQSLLHGQAVAIGSCLEAELSLRKNFISDEDLLEIKAMFTKFGLPTELPTGINFEEFYAKVVSDKKNVAGKVNWTLLGSIGEGLVDQDVEESLLKEVFHA